MSDLSDLLDELGVAAPYIEMADEMAMDTDAAAQGLQQVIGQNYSQFDAQRRQQ